MLVTGVVLINFGAIKGHVKITKVASVLVKNMLTLNCNFIEMIFIFIITRV